MDLTLVVMAAGIGSRFGGLKQLEPVGPGGECLMEYSIFDAIRSGFNRVVMVIRPETESDFRIFLDARVGDNISVEYVFQTLDDLPAGVEPPTGRTKPWGTGQAVLVAEHKVPGPFAVINADDFYGADAFDVVARSLKAATEENLPVFFIPGFSVGPTLSDAGAVSRALCQQDEDGWLERIVEILELWKDSDGGWYTDAHGSKHLVGPDDLVSMNMWGFTRALFPELRKHFMAFLDTHGQAPTSEYLLPDVVQGMIDHGLARVRVLRHQGQWCGITFPEDRGKVRDFIRYLVARGDYMPRLWEDWKAE